MTTFRSLLFALSAATLSACAGDLSGSTGDPSHGPSTGGVPGNGSTGTTAGAALVARAVLPAATFADGPVSGTMISGGIVGGTFPGQPVQGISSLVDARDGTFLAMADNGYGTLDNSADFRLRIYRLRPNSIRPGGCSTRRFRCPIRTAPARPSARRRTRSSRRRAPCGS